MMSHALHGSHQESNPGQVVTKRLLFDFSEENSTIPDVGAERILSFFAILGLTFGGQKYTKRHRHGLCQAVPRLPVGKCYR